MQFCDYSQWKCANTMIEQRERNKEMTICSAILESLLHLSQRRFHLSEFVSCRPLLGTLLPQPEVCWELDCEGMKKSSLRIFSLYLRNRNSLSCFFEPEIQILSSIYFYSANFYFQISGCDLFRLEDNRRRYMANSLLVQWYFKFWSSSQI